MHLFISVVVTFMGMGARPVVTHMVISLFLMIYAIQVSHIVIMIFKIPVQYDIKITNVQTCFFDTTDSCSKPFDRYTFQRLIQCFLACSQIQQRSYHHVTTDAGKAFQIESLFHVDFQVN